MAKITGFQKSTIERRVYVKPEAQDEDLVKVVRGTGENSFDATEYGTFVNPENP